MLILYKRLYLFFTIDYYISKKMNAKIPPPQQQAQKGWIICCCSLLMAQMRRGPKNKKDNNKDNNMLAFPAYTLQHNTTLPRIVIVVEVVVNNNRGWCLIINASCYLLQKCIFIVLFSTTLVHHLTYHYHLQHRTNMIRGKSSTTTCNILS